MKAILPLFLILSSAGAASPSAQKTEEVEALVRALDSEDDAIRTPAIEALVKAGRKVSARLFAELESRSAHRRARVGVLDVLGRMKRTGAGLLEDEILQPIHSGSIQRISAVLSALQEAGPAAGWAAPSLVKLIERKPDRAFMAIHMLVRSSAIVALGSQGPSTASITTLLEKQLEEEDIGVRLSSACALWWTGSDGALVYPVLLEGLKATKDKVALERAIFGLGEMGARATDAVGQLEALRERVSEETKTVIVDALAKIRGYRPPVGPRSK